MVKKVVGVEEKKESSKKKETKEEVFIDVKKKEEVIPIGSVSFPCPSCGKSKIIRSYEERRLVTPYKCKKCNFEGPN